ncbi:MAG TPA: hypothetical protein VLZ10_17065 [Thermodesulfobacteriota bacterium]|nr:hypothetical protein [Thermodesulfobacteriota bacterium]
MKVAEGDRYKEKLTGQLYRVRSINHGTVVLEAEGVANRFWAGDRLLNLFFERIENQKKRPA